MAKKEIQVEYNALTAPFRKALAELNKDLKITEGQFKIQEQEAKNAGDVFAELTAQVQKVAAQYDFAKQKVAMIQSALAQSKTITGENSKETKNLTDQLMRAQLQEAKLAGELQNANSKYVEAVKNTNLLTQAEARSAIEKEKMIASLGALRQETERLSISSSKIQSTFELSNSVTGRYADSIFNLTNKKKALSSQIEANKQTLNSMDRELQLSKDMYGANSIEVAKLEKEMIDLAKETSDLDQALREAVGKGLQDFGNKVQKVGDGMRATGDSMTKYITAPLTLGVGASVKAAAEFDDAFTGVTKTVDEVYDASGRTVISYEDLKNSIRGIAKEVPMTTTEIANLAETGGRLGIETKNIDVFARTMADLMVSTNLSVEEGADKLAKYMNITKMSQEDIGRLGSSLVALGNNFATTEDDIVNMSMNLAGAGKQIGMSDAQILGLSTALSSVGIQAERGGTAFSKVMIELQLATVTASKEMEKLAGTVGLSSLEFYEQYLKVKDNKDELKAFASTVGMTDKEMKQTMKTYEEGSKTLDQFAAVAGMSADDFKKAFQEDAGKALTMFIEGLSAAQKAGTPAIKVLDDMGISEVRMRDALLRATNATEVFSSATAVATKGWSENVALTNEAQKKYGTFNSQLKLLKNEMNDIGIDVGGVFIKALRDIIKASQPIIKNVADAAKAFSQLSKEEQEAKVKTIAFIMALGPMLSIGGRIISGGGKIISVIGEVSSALGKAKGASDTFTTGMKGLEAVTGKSLGSAGLGKFASFLTGPWGIAVAAGVAGFAAIKGSIDAANNRQIAGMNNEFRNMSKALDDAQPSIKDFSTIFGSLKAKYDELSYSISQNTNAMNQSFKNASEDRRAFTNKEFETIKAVVDGYEKLAEVTAKSGGQKLAQRRVELAAQKSLTDQQYADEMASLKNYTAQVEQANKESREKQYTALIEARKAQRNAEDAGNQEDIAKAKAHYQTLLSEYETAISKQDSVAMEQVGKHLDFINQRYWADKQGQLESIKQLEQYHANIADLEAKSLEKLRQSNAETDKERKHALNVESTDYENQRNDQITAMQEHFRNIDEASKAHYAQQVILKASSGAELTNLEKIFMNQWTEAIISGTADQKKALESNIQQQLEAIHGGTADGQAKIERFMQEFNKALNGGDPTALKNLMLENGLGMTAAQGEVSSRLKSITDGIDRELGDTAKRGNTHGKDLGNNVADGIDSTSGNVRNSASNMGSSAAISLGQHASVFRSTGSQFAQGVADGISEGSYSAENAASNLASNTKGSMNKMYDYGYAGGGWFSEGVYDGIYGKLHVAYNAGSALASQAKMGFNETLSIESPSKKMRESGGWAGEGAVLGVLDKVKYMRSASEELANAARVPFDDLSVGIENDTMNAYNGVRAARGITIVNNNTLNGSADETRLANKISRTLDRFRREDDFATGGI